MTYTVKSQQPMMHSPIQSDNRCNDFGNLNIVTAKGLNAEVNVPIPENSILFWKFEFYDLLVISCLLMLA